MKRRILIIEDDDGVRVAAAAALETRLDCEVIEAAHPRRGVHMAERQQPDLILLDTTLPELDTARVLIELHANPSTRDIPVILMQASAAAEGERGVAAGRPPAGGAVGQGGVVGTIAKPLEGEVLVREVIRLAGW